MFIKCETTVLDNGVKIISERNTSVQSFSLGFWFNTGSRDENSSNNGISHFVEHMLFEGTYKRNAKKISDEVEALGCYLNAFTTKEYTCFYGRGLSPHIKKVFEVLSDMVQNPLFEKKEIEKEASVVIDELYDIEDTPEELVFDEFEKNLFRGNPLQYPIIGTEKNIKNFTREDLVDFINKHYGLNNLYIVASGNVEHNKLVKLAEKFLTSNFNTNKKSRQTVNLKPVKDNFVYKDIQQAHLIVGKPTNGYLSRDRHIIKVLSYILGEGSSSRLFQSVREKNGIAYQVNSFLNSFYDVSSFGVYISTNDKSIAKAHELILTEFKKMREKGVTIKELKRAKESLKSSIMMGLEDTTNRMVRIAHSSIYFNKIKTVYEYIDEIESVNREQLLELSYDLLDEKKMIKTFLSAKNHLLHSAA